MFKLTHNITPPHPPGRPPRATSQKELLSCWLTPWFILSVLELQVHRLTQCVLLLISLLLLIIAPARFAHILHHFSLLYTIPQHNCTAICLASSVDGRSACVQSFSKQVCPGPVATVCFHLLWMNTQGWNVWVIGEGGSMSGGHCKTVFQGGCTILPPTEVS